MREDGSSLAGLAGAVPIHAVIFDVDGTLVDSVDLHAAAWQEALAHFDIEVTFDQVRSQIGKGGDQLLPVFVPRDMLAKKQEEIEKFRTELFTRKYRTRVRPFPSVRPLFEFLKNGGRRVGLASSANKDELNFYKQLASVGDLVDAETSADDVQRSKPHPDVFDVVVEKLGVTDRSTAIVVGDSPYDAEAAGRAGLQTIGVLCGGFPEEALRSAGCRAIYSGPRDLMQNSDWLFP